MKKLHKKSIYVTKSFLPPIKEYQEYLSKIWHADKITNQGPLIKELESKLCTYIGADYLHIVNNGTIALQLALNALGITEGEIITTPFSYVATTSAILWERCKPVYVDIDSKTLCIDASKIEAAITENTRAILAVHVFGVPCDVEKIEEIANKYGLKVIYDGAHAFGVTYKNKSLLSYGDVSICSFHATKLFHMVEGGCVIAKDSFIDEKLELIKRFGHHGDEHCILGINAKASEFHAAMGLCNFKYLKNIFKIRKKISELYDDELNESICIPQTDKDTEINYSYYPVLFDKEDRLLKILNALNKESIYPRRYFYPSLNLLPYLNDKKKCPISEDISKRILCLPLYVGLKEDDIKNICRIINNAYEN